MRLILGGPGCGKTTRLLNLLEEELQHCEPTQVGFLAFTRKAAEEARSRAGTRFGYGDDDLPFFRTIHSLAFRQLGLSTNQVMSSADYAELGVALGVKIGVVDADYGVPLGGELGDRLVFTEQLARVRGLPLEAVAKHLNLWQLRQFRASLEAFKKSRGVIDFTDMITDFLASGDVPAFKVLFIDEAQDLTPLHWLVADALVERADTVYLAGDDDQAIYQWAGADVRKFLTLPADQREVLPVSHRLNRQTWGLSDAIARRIRARYPKEWKPRDEDGLINKFDKTDQVNMRDGSWLVLARHNYLLNGAVVSLRRNGVPYVFKGASSIDNPSVRAIVSWEMMRRGEALPWRRVQQMVRQLKKHYVTVVPSKDTQGDTPLRLGDLGWTSEPPDWMEAINLTDNDREYYRAIRRNGESLTKSPRIKVSTIHASKGGEADHVMLLRDMSETCHQEYMRTPDDECRVFFVGASRAKQTLSLQHPQTGRFFHLPA